MSTPNRQSSQIGKQQFQILNTYYNINCQFGVTLFSSQSGISSTIRNGLGTLILLHVILVVYIPGIQTHS